MTTIHQLIDQLQHHDIKLAVHNGNLQINAPKGALTPELRAQLTTHKAALTALFAQQQQQQPIHHEPFRESAPLSFAQQRLWFLEQLGNTGTTYHLATLLAMTGPLRVDWLEASIATVVARHTILRTVYQLVDEQPMQIVRPPHPVKLTPVDLSALSPADQEAAVYDAVRLAQEERFDLKTGPLWRFSLFFCGPQRWRFAIVLHHLITDEWSTSIFVQEISACYHALSAGTEPQLPALPIQYADYAAWQRAAATTEAWQQQFQALCDQLRAATPVTVPFDQPRSATPTLAAGRLAFELTPELSAALQRLAAAHGTTLYTILLTAFALLLGRYTQRQDVVIGSPVANRDRSELEPLIGFLVNTLALRLAWESDLPFTALLTQVRQQVLDALGTGHIPFELLVEALQPERRLNQNPLFQVMFVWQNELRHTLDLPDLSIDLIESPPTNIPVDLLLTMRMDEATTTGAPIIVGQLLYSCELYQETTMAAFVVHLQVLLTAIVASPDHTVATLPLFGAQAQRQLLKLGRGLTQPELAQTTLHRLFEAQAEQTPLAPAIYWAPNDGDASVAVVSYGQLNALANQLAHRLLAAGCGAGDRIAICAGRTPMAITALLAVSKIGAAYVPLDPDYPAERLLYMIEDAAVALLLHDEMAPALLVAGLVSLHLGEIDLGTFPNHNPGVAVTVDQQIYQIYTSGSTGQPKGVVVNHAGVANTIRAIAEQIDLQSTDRLFQFIPMGFDASAIDFFATLCHGAALVLHPTPTRLSADELLHLCDQYEVSIVNFTVALWQQWVTNLQLQQRAFPRRLRVFLTGGEKPAAHTLHAWATLAEHPMLYCCSYGPTEASITTTFYTITADAVRSTPPPLIPMGRPLPNMAIYLLDDAQQLVPRGVVGELYIGGVGLATGYWQRPELTAERFVIVPSFDKDHGTKPLRLYRTGDLARLLPDGTYEFMGRVDTQVKIRGFRIELGEIESRLRAQPDVTEAVVLALDGLSGDKQLVAYVQGTSTEASLAASLARELPDHMVPRRWIFIDAWPLTPNGKIDRAALPAPTVHEEDVHVVAPRTPLEAAIATIWQTILGREELGVTHNFFALGGHSLLATQVIARIEHQLGYALPLRVLFEQPTIAGLAAAIAESTTIDNRPPLLPVDRGVPLPLSFAQQRLWLIQQIDPTSSAYNLPATLHFAGQLDEAALTAAFTQLSARHEILRTQIVTTVIDGEPVPRQEILPAQPFLVRQVDLRDLPVAERAAAAQAQAMTALQQPFDLATDPLLRATLFQLAATESILFVEMHHIITDGWSIPLLLAELSALYRSALTGTDAALPPLTIQYADYAHWQQRWLQGGVLDSQLAYWREQLRGAPELLALPTDYSRPATPTYAAATYTMTLDSLLVAQLTALAQRHDATPYMVMVAAVGLLLSRYSGQDDVVIGSPIANRTHPALEPLIGFFVNTLALRLNLAGAATFTALLERVRTTTLDAYTHQDAPFEQILEQLHLPRKLSHAPLFQVLLAWQSNGAVSGMNTAAGLPELPGVTVQPVPWQKPTLTYDLALEITEEYASDGDPASTQTLTIQWQYSTDLFTETTIVQMAMGLQQLLTAALADPVRPLKQLSLLSHEHRAQMVAWGTGPQQLSRSTIPLHQQFADQAARTPTAPVIFFVEEGPTALSISELCYGELNGWANQLAHYLLHKGYGPGDRIALCLDRKPALVAAMLAVLKIGAAYVPLDPVYPAERLGYLVRDAQAALLISEWALAAQLPDTSCPLLWLDQIDIDEQPATDPAIVVPPDAPFYQIYTSGSTGEPKGVLPPHQGIANTIRATAAAIGLGPGDRFFQFVPIGFDAAAIDFFAPLATGAALVMHPTPTQLADHELIAIWQQCGVTLTNFATARWQQLVRNLAAQEQPLPTSLRVVLTGGEKPSAATLQQWATLAAPGMRFVSSYGPSETSISAMIYVTNREAVSESPPALIPLGNPMPNVAIYLLDEARQLVPPGVIGEIYIGGVGVAGSYWQRPALSAERFLTVPAFDGSATDLTLYRTGDLARWLPDGRCEFVGRVDSQVKIRGFRIELGEIEAQIRNLPGVQEAVVLAQPTARGDNEVVAYLQAGEDERAGEDEIIGQARAALQARLPSHLLPAAWVVISAWPLTPNGKIDRGQLPLPTAERAQAIIAPRTALEATIAAIWQEVLGLDEIGVTADFFALGGHSLSATQVVARLQQQLGVAVPLRTLFAQPTIAELALVLTAADPVVARPPVVPVSRAASLPLSFAQQRLWFMQQLAPESSFLHMPAALWLEGPLELAALQQTFDALVARHESLRTRFPLVTGEPVQQIDPPYRVLLNIALDSGDASNWDEAMIQEWVLAHADEPFDLAQGPLLRVALLRVNPERHLLLVTLHHAIGDDWSRRIFLAEFALLYQAYLDGEAHTLPPLAIQYADFAAWQHTWLAEGVLEQQRTYWRTQLADAPPLLELPTDYPRPPEQQFRGGRVHLALDPALATAVRHFGREQGATLHMTLLAAYALLLARYSGMDDIVIGIPVAGRNNAQLEPLIGCFLNTLALRIAVDPALDFAALLAHVRQVALDGYANQDLPFEQVIEAIRPAQQQSYSPIFQVMFDLAQAEQSPFTLPGLTTTPVVFDLPTVKYDLYLSLQEEVVTAGGDSTESEQIRLTAIWEYRSDLFAHATVTRMATHFVELLRQLIATPANPVGRQTFLTMGERNELLHRWNKPVQGTAVAEPAAAAIMQPMQTLFEAQVLRTPDATAARYRHETLTYRALNERANRWAHQLIAMGIEAECIVVPFAPRNLDFLTAILATFKAGGAYLPLDPHLPAVRLAQIFAQSRCHLILTTAPFLPLVQAALAELPEQTRPQWALLTDLDNAGNANGNNEVSTANPPSRNTLDSLAYIIYTSGSTGLPKGVMVEQRGLVNHLWAMRQQLALTPADQIGQSAPQSYVISVWQFLAALTLGASLQIVPQETVVDPEAFVTLIAQRELTVVQVVPSLLRVMVEVLQRRETEQERAQFPRLRWMIPTGEALPPALARHWLALCPHVPMLNAYGASECSDDVTHDLIATPPAPTRMTMPIGEPLPNVQIYILDRAGHPVPYGVAGELYVAGRGVGRGYLHDPVRTAERFLSNPFAPATAPAWAQRLYRTGDRVRRLSDGTVDYLGRVDFQIKVRGIRVELGEVEAVLTEHPAVTQAVVITQEDPHGTVQLLGYVLCHAGAEITPSVLRHFLSERLPVYMVPAVVMILETLPVNSSGKVARRALPLPTELLDTTAHSAVAAHTYVAPCNDVEQKVVEILATVLAKAELRKEHPTEAYVNLAKARQLAVANKFLLLELEICEVLVMGYQEQGLWREAYRALSEQDRLERLIDRRA